MIQKSANWVNYSPGSFGTPGGHPEPKNVDFTINLEEINRQENPKTSKFALDFTQINSKIAHEIFKSQKDEIMVELNLQESDLTSHRLHSIIGCPYVKDTSDQKFWNRPVFYFVTTTNLTSQEIIKRHQQGGIETDEIDFLNAWDLADVKKNFLDRKNGFNISGLLSVGTFLYSRNLINLDEFSKTIRQQL